MHNSFPKSMAHNQSSSISNQEVYPEETLERIREVISTLPLEDGWRLIKPLFLHQGTWYFPYFLENVLLAQACFQAEPSDVLLCSLPKSGTTWLKAMAFTIVTRTRYDNSANPLLYHLPHSCMPDLGVCFTKKLNAREPGLPLIASHAPYHALPKSVQDSDCKIVYICRDPKDTFISSFHFVAKFRPEENEPLSLEEAFELLCNGRSSFGPFWDHTLGYWKASLERPEKVLFLKYEEMMEDPDLHVKKLAHFIGCPFSTEEEEQGAIQKIVEMCSFEFLSNLEINKNGKTGKLGLVQNKDFFRKGRVGDWKNHLTPEMARRMDEIVEQKLGPFGLTFSSSSI